MYISSIYTNASKLSKFKNVRISLVIYKYTIPIILIIAFYSKSGNLGSSVIIYNSELEAVTSAIEYTISIIKRGEYYNVFNNN